MFSLKHHPVAAPASAAPLPTTAGSLIPAPLPASQPTQQSPAQNSQQTQANFLPDFSVVSLNADSLAVIVTDLHGTIEPLQEILKRQDVLRYGKKAVIFVAGDILDKGRNVAELYRLIKEMNQKHHAGGNVPKIILSLGNHEAMFICWISQVLSFMRAVGFTSNMDIAKEMQTPKQPLLYSLLFEHCPDILQSNIPNANSASSAIAQPVSKEWLHLLQKLQPLTKLIPCLYDALANKFGDELFATLISACTVNYSPNWLMQLGIQEIVELINDLTQLPFIIRVLWPNSNIMPAFNIVHADLPIPLSGIDFSSGKFPSLTAEQRYHALWARPATPTSAAEILNCAGNGPTFCGHNSLCSMRQSTDGEMIANLDSFAYKAGQSLMVLINDKQATATITSGANFPVTFDQQQLSVFKPALLSIYKTLLSNLSVYKPAPMPSNLMFLLSVCNQVVTQYSQPASTATTYQPLAHSGLNLHPQLQSLPLPQMFFSIPLPKPKSSQKACQPNATASPAAAPASLPSVQSCSSVIHSAAQLSTIHNS